MVMELHFVIPSCINCRIQSMQRKPRSHTLGLSSTRRWKLILCSCVTQQACLIQFCYFLVEMFPTVDLWANDICFFELCCHEDGIYFVLINSSWGKWLLFNWQNGHLKMLGGYLEFFMKPALAETYVTLKRELDELIQSKVSEFLLFGLWNYEAVEVKAIFWLDEFRLLVYENMKLVSK